MDEEIKYAFEVLEVRSDDEPGQNGVQVRYTPEWEECSVIDKFVPVPFHKCRDKEHAREVMEKKIRARAPAAQWRNELAEDESGDTKAIGDELAGDLGVKNEPTADTGGSAGSDSLPESSGDEGGGSGADGAHQVEAAHDGAEIPAAGTTGAGPRIRR